MEASKRNISKKPQVPYLSARGLEVYLDIAAPLIDALGFVLAQVLWMLTPFDRSKRLETWADLLEMPAEERAAMWAKEQE